MNNKETREFLETRLMLLNKEKEIQKEYCKSQWINDTYSYRGQTEAAREKEIVEISNNLVFLDELEHLNTKVELEKRYFLTDNVYFYIYFNKYDSAFQCYFYIDNDQLIYDYYIGSHSGANEWITKLIQDEYDLVSGNSKYSYAFGTFTMEEMMTKVNDSTFKHRAELIEILINFVEGTGECKRYHDMVVELLNTRFSLLEKFVEKYED